LASTDYNLKKHYDFKNITIIKEFEPDLPLVICEQAKVQQVLFNLLQNGAQAMEQVTTRSSQFIIRLKRDPDDKKIIIEIEDNGPGMDQTTAKRVFEPFFTTKSVDEGTGLGLSISYFIITKNHNGEMFVESIEGIGTKFIIKLPL
jgi:signal transduction histidine kinase